MNTEELKNINNILKSEIVNLRYAIENLEKIIKLNEQLIRKSCEEHEWILDSVDYDRTYYRCNKNCGAWK